MYIYFDNNGVLKEIITERPFRAGDSQRDKIYIYWDGEHTPTAGWVKYRKADRTTTTETQFSLTKVNKTLPTEPLRNLKYFSYEHTYIDSGVVKVGYPFYELTVPSEVLTSAVSGDLIPTSNNMCVANVRFVFSDSSIDNLGVIVFSVETSIGILTDNSISETQYNYLIAEISQKFGIDNLRSVKVDELPEEGETGTIYYVKIEDEEIYDVYFWNALTTAFVFAGTTSCGLYTQGEGATFESNINEEINDFKEDVNEQLDDMTETIQGLGQLQPSGTTTSTNLPTSNQGILIATDNGHWYYWNGTQYADGGVYQATQIADNSIEFNHLTNDCVNLLDRKFQKANITFTVGKYINNAGTDFSNNNSFSYTASSVEIKPNQTIILRARGYLQSYQTMIALSDSESNLNGRIIVVIDSNLHDYTYTNFSNKSVYVMLSIENYYTPQVFLSLDDNIIETVDATLVESGYFNQYGNKSNNTQYRRSSEPIILKQGDTISLIAYCDSGATSPLVRYYKSTNDYLPLVIGAGNTTYAYTATDFEEEIYYCYHNSYTRKVSITRNKILKDNYFKETIENIKPQYAPYMFTNVLGIGDSITYGNSYGNYLDNMSRIFGWNTTNGGIGGYTALQWWNARKDTYDYTDYDLVIIELGTNGGLTDTIDEDTAIDEGETYLDYADTNTGRYCSIIEQIKAQNPNCKILLMNKYVVDATQETTNLVINKIATKYNLFVLDVLEMQKYRFDNVIHSLGDDVHFGKMGYYVFTKVVIEQIEKIVDENMYYFN